MTEETPQLRRVIAAESAKNLCEQERFVIYNTSDQTQLVDLKGLIEDVGRKYFGLDKGDHSLAIKFVERTNELIERRSGVTEPNRKLVSLQKALEQLRDPTTGVDVTTIREGREAIEGLKLRAGDRADYERHDMTPARVKERTAAFNASRMPGQDLTSANDTHDATAGMFRKHYHREKALELLGKQMDEIMRTLAIELPDRKPTSTQRIF